MFVWKDDTSVQCRFIRRAEFSLKILYRTTFGLPESKTFPRIYFGNRGEFKGGNRKRAEAIKMERKTYREIEKNRSDGVVEAKIRKDFLRSFGHFVATQHNRRKVAKDRNRTAVGERLSVSGVLCCFCGQ